DSIGIYDPDSATWMLHNGASGGAVDAGTFGYGWKGAVPVVGDWTGTGHVGIGVVDPQTGTWYLRNTVSGGAPDIVFQYGWKGGLKDSIGLFNPLNATWYLHTGASGGAADAGIFQFGKAGDVPVVGNWQALAAQAGDPILSLNLDPLNINLLGLQVQTNQI